MLRSFSLAFVLGLVAALGAQPSSHTDRSSYSDARASEAFAHARAQGPLALHAFLERMPKGADLHMHLSGAIYAETFLKDALDDRLCIDAMQHTIVKIVGVSAAKPTEVICPDGTAPAANAFHDQKLYDDMVDSLSMRSFVPSAGTSGHDQFFATFGRAGGLGHDHTAEWLDEVATRAARQNEQYLEVMGTPDFTRTRALAHQLGWPTHTDGSSLGDNSAPAKPDGTSRSELSALRDKLLAGGLRDDIALDRSEFDDSLAQRKKLERCDEPIAAPACSVEIRILYQVLRSAAPEQVFAQTLLAFEVAASDPNVVGLNFVQPEDAYLAMSEYHRQMLMLDYLHSVYPKVHISLHAGELAPGLVPPAGLLFHIREAVELGHAERIGHGVDVMYESDPDGLLKEMSKRKTMVEINLTSNDVILGVTAPMHPLPNYRAAHVPVALSTDDEGVSRIDLTNEYTRAAIEFHLTYADLKQMARTSLEHSFLPGQSLWRDPDTFTTYSGPCNHQETTAGDRSYACEQLLKASEKAQQQYELESRFRLFESAITR